MFRYGAQTNYIFPIGLLGVHQEHVHANLSDHLIQHQQIDPRTRTTTRVTASVTTTAATATAPPTATASTTTTTNNRAPTKATPSETMKQSLSLPSIIVLIAAAIFTTSTTPTVCAFQPIHSFRVTAANTNTRSFPQIIPLTMVTSSDSTSSSAVPADTDKTGTTTTNNNNNKNNDKIVNSLPDWDPTNWTPKRLHNSPLFRSAALLGAVTLAGASSRLPIAQLSSTAAATTHILAFGTWFGTMMYTTLVAGLTMYRNLPRQMFGKLQSKLFPQYFSLCSASCILQLFTVAALPGISKKATSALTLALVMSLVNQFYLEPKSTKIMFARYDMENSDDPDAKTSPEYKKLASQFGQFHGMSSLTNLVALCAAVAHGYFLGSSIVA